MTIAAAALCGSPAPTPLVWRRWEDLPDAVGRKGMYAGVSQGWVLLAGGSNFPVPAATAGRKTFHRDVFVRRLPLSPAQPWRIASFRLPVPLGEGASATTPEGVACVGGHDGRAAVAMAFLLRWNAREDEVESCPLPALPVATANAAAAWHEGWLYVLGGEDATGAHARFWRLPLARALADPAGIAWEELPLAEGAPGRFGCILAVTATPSGPQLVAAGGLSGPPKSQADYRCDVWRFHPLTRQWTRGAEMPRGAVLASAVPVDGGVLVLGGSDGHDFARIKELGERYRLPNEVLLYDGRHDRWRRMGEMPIGAAGASVVPLDRSWLLVGGEYAPTLRTPAVHELTWVP
ncbi:hypothetical protein [Oleiharenicola sp. Vm1]|uniref:hypothetical protein n=1 Tax=Oleiharenicola sp. Vm1 TaxID=3398393 RepID=UPI0039F4B293